MIIHDKKYYITCIDLYYCYPTVIALLLQINMILSYLIMLFSMCFTLVCLQKPEEDQYPVGPWLLGLFIFVVCGSGNVLGLNYVNRNLVCM